MMVFPPFVMIRFFKRRKPASSIPPPPALGHLETTIMQILWTHGESNVREVAGRLDRPLAYTTVMTTLDRLFKKGLLARRKSDRAFYYSPNLSPEQWEEKRAGHLMSEFLSGPRSSGEMLISCLVDAVGEADAALLDELEHKIKNKRRELNQREVNQKEQP